VPITFKCPKCDKLLVVPDERAGTAVRCPGCQTAITAPAGTLAPPLVVPIAAAPAPAPLPSPPDQDDFPVLEEPSDESQAGDDGNMRHERWRNVRRALSLNLVATGLYLLFLVAGGVGLIELMGNPQGIKAGSTPAVFSLIGGLALLASWVVALVGYGFALEGSRASGGRGAALAALLATLVSAGMGIYLAIELREGIPVPPRITPSPASPRMPGDFARLVREGEAFAAARVEKRLQHLRDIAIVLVGAEAVRWTCFALFLWAALRSLPGRRSAWEVLGVAFTLLCVLLGALIAGLLLDQDSGKADNPIEFRSKFLLTFLAAFAVVLIGFGFVTLGGRQAVSRHLHETTT
jgi:hypothetical protein